MGYSQYKIVDNPWLKKVPSTWDMIPNKVLFTKRQVKVGEGFYKYQLLSLTTQGVKEKDINDVKGKVPASYNNYQMVRPGDMVFCLFDLDVSAVFAGVSPYSGMITSAYDVAECNEKYIIPQYMNYWFQYVFFGRHYKMYSKNVRYTLSFDAFGSIKTPVPPRAEQDQIVRYLDWKVSEINRLINIKKEQVFTVEELKESLICDKVLHGLDNGTRYQQATGQWYGSIPVNWREHRIKNLFDLRDERNFESLENVNLISLYTKLGVVQNKDVEYKTGNRARNADGYKKVYKDDIIVNIILCWMGAIGRCAYDGVTSPAYDIYCPKTNVCSRYYHYVFRTKKFSGECYKAGKGIMKMRWRTYSPQFRNITVPYPPMDEQRKIADYLDSQIKQMDDYMNKIQSEIELLRAYKSRLISDVVTGQIDVRGIDIPEYEYVEETADIDSEEMTEFEESEDEEV